MDRDNTPKIKIKSEDATSLQHTPASVRLGGGGVGGSASSVSRTQTPIQSTFSSDGQSEAALSTLTQLNLLRDIMQLIETMPSRVDGGATTTAAGGNSTQSTNSTHATLQAMSGPLRRRIAAAREALAYLKQHGNIDASASTQHEHIDLLTSQIENRKQLALQIQSMAESLVAQHQKTSPTPDNNDVSMTDL